MYGTRSKIMNNAIPLFISSISAGFPSPADDYIEQRLNLNDLLIPHKEATFFLRVQGDSMIGQGIHHGDLLIVDRSLNIASKKIIIAVLDGELLVKQLYIQKNKVFLLAANPNYKTIAITSEQNFQIWGVVTAVIHSF